MGKIVITIIVHTNTLQAARNAQNVVSMGTQNQNVVSAMYVGKEATIAGTVQRGTQKVKAFKAAKLCAPLKIIQKSDTVLVRRPESD